MSGEGPAPAPPQHLQHQPQHLPQHLQQHQHLQHDTHAPQAWSTTHMRPSNTHTYTHSTTHMRTHTRTYTHTHTYTHMRCLG